MAALIMDSYALPASISIKDNQSHVVIDNLAQKLIQEDCASRLKAYHDEIR
jgi:hypothetical protein